MLVFRSADEKEVDEMLTGRIYEPLFLYETQGITVYKVYAKPTQASTEAPAPHRAMLDRRRH